MAEEVVLRDVEFEIGLDNHDHAQILQQSDW